jgi:hypothetical protein
MPRPEPDPDTVRLAQVLSGLTFPALRWQLIAQADYYGADTKSRTELDRLPTGLYRDLAAVISAVNATARPNRSPGNRPR